LAATSDGWMDVGLPRCSCNYCVGLFTELQLKPEHKPVQHLKKWKSQIVVMFTDQDPAKEDPQLFWRRDAILTIDMEKKVSAI